MPLPRLARTPCLEGIDPQAKRAEILHYFHNTFDVYESLFEVLACDEAYYRKPIPLRHPLIFYFGHTATFFVNKLVLAGLLTERIEPRFESMFAVGVDEMSWDDLNEAHYDWPAVAEVAAYRRRVRSAVDALIRRLPLALPIGWSDPFWPILMGIEHERIHLETSSVLIRQHALAFVRPHPAWQPWRECGPAPANALVEVPAGEVVLGRDVDDPWYGWDNEYGRHRAGVPAFRAARHLVSNAEFLPFVQAGGYQDDSLWSEEGLGWRQYAAATHPTFWVADATGWRLRLMTEEVDMPWNWPVETNHHEAKAFCNWLARERGLPVRLPTEDEWHRIHAVAAPGEPPADAPMAANLHLDHGASSCPVDRFAHGPFFDAVGNVWQWCETPTYPFEGFKVHPLYDDFSTPTFDNRHNLIKGGAWISAGNEARTASRYAFRRHFFQHAGFRYVVSTAPAALPCAQYETDTALAQYAEFHYGAPYFGVANFPKALAEAALAAFARHGNGPARRALDLGCAAGRASFELARCFDEVVGIDFSARFIQSAVRLAETGQLRYALPEEGELVSYHEHSLAEFGLDTVRHKVAFWQGDACNLQERLGRFDLILAANLIDRLYNPAQCLATLHERLQPGGLLLIASPYTWLAEHTRREQWLGGFKKDGESWHTLDGLKAVLNARFELLEAPRDLPFVLRETRRKFQHTLSELSLWRLREATVHRP